MKVQIEMRQPNEAENLAKNIAATQQLTLLVVVVVVLVGGSRRGREGGLVDTEETS